MWNSDFSNLQKDKEDWLKEFERSWVKFQGSIEKKELLFRFIVRFERKWECSRSRGCTVRDFTVSLRSEILGTRLANPWQSCTRVGHCRRLSQTCPAGGVAVSQTIRLNVDSLRSLYIRAFGYSAIHIILLLSFSSAFSFPVLTAPGKFEKLPFTLIQHKKSFSRTRLNRINLKTQGLRSHVDGKHFEKQKENHHGSASRTKIMKTAVHVVVLRYARGWPVWCGKGRSAGSVCRSRPVWRPSFSDACPWVHPSFPLQIQWQLVDRGDAKHYGLQPGLTSTGGQHGMQWGISWGSPCIVSCTCGLFSLSVAGGEFAIQ